MEDQPMDQQNDLNEPVSRAAPPLPRVTKAAINRVIHLMVRFRNEFQEQNIIENRNQDDESDEPEEFRFAGVNMPELRSVASAFENYFQEQLDASALEFMGPFRNEMIIREIMEYLPMKDVCRMRLVNRTFKRSAVSLKRRLKTVALRRPHEFVKFYSDVEPFEENGERIPFPAFEIQVMDRVPCEQYLTFALNHGPHVTELSLHCNVLDEDLRNDRIRSDLDRNMAILFQNIPKIKDLRVAISHGPSEFFFLFGEEELKNARLPTVTHLTYAWFKHTSEQYLPALFRLTPNIESLHIVWAAEDDFKSRQCKFLDTSCVRLKSLRLSEHAQTAPARLLKHFQEQKLEELNINVDVQNEWDALAYRTFFESQSETLETLTVQWRMLIRSSGIFTAMNFSGIVMEKVKDATFHYTRGPMGLCPLVPILSTQFPNLQKFCIDLEVLSKFVDPIIPFVGVTEMNATRSIWSDSAILKKNIELVSSIFPNLTKLKISSIGLLANDLPFLFQSLQLLEDLDVLVTLVWSNEDINIILSGIPNQNEELVNQLMTGNYEELDKIISPLPCFQDMTRLTRLMFRYEVSYDRPHIMLNDSGFQMGFLRMQPLEHLTVSGCFTLSPEMVIKCTNYHKHVFLKQSNDHRYCFPVEDADIGKNLI